MIKAIIDTNILVSALLTKTPQTSIPFIILTNVLIGNIQIIISEKIYKEYQEVLKRKKFSFNETLVNTLLEQIKMQAIIYNPMKSNDYIPDNKDRVFYDLAISSKDDTILVTGNIKHFPNCTNALTPRIFYEKYLENLIK